jgi:hypothetical protein
MSPKAFLSSPYRWRASHNRMEMLYYVSATNEPPTTSAVYCDLHLPCDYDLPSLLKRSTVPARLQTQLVVYTDRQRLMIIIYHHYINSKYSSSLLQIRACLVPSQYLPRWMHAEKFTTSVIRITPWCLTTRLHTMKPNCITL